MPHLLAASHTGTDTGDALGPNSAAPPVAQTPAVVACSDEMNSAEPTSYFSHMLLIDPTEASSSGVSVVIEIQVVTVNTTFFHAPSGFMIHDFHRIEFLPPRTALKFPPIYWKSGKV